MAVSNLLRLLDLPDEALELLEAGALSEGHGRALLLAPDHGERRRLARAALRRGLERARDGGPGPRDEQPQASRAPRGARRPHPDQVEAAERLGEAFGRALGADVRVTPRADGYQVSLAFASLDEALEVAERLGVTAAA